MEEKKKNTGAIVGTVVAVVFCGLPGIVAACFGAISAIVSFIPGSAIDIYGSNDPQVALLTGIGSLCAGIILIAIPVVVGVLTLRRKKTGTGNTREPVSNEPLPPAS
jgi:hypothetical protein